MLDCWFRNNLAWPFSCRPVRNSRHPASEVRAPMNDEWINQGADEPVRQGDLLLSRDPNTGHIADLCIVITADCDIAHQKFGKQLACLRVAPLRDYFRTDWAGRKLRRSFD